MWQTLVPGNLPTKHLNLVFDDFNPRHSLASIEFTGFVRLDKTMTARSCFDFEHIAYYLSPNCAEKVTADLNYYGALFSIEVGTAFVKLEDYCLSDSDCQDTSMRLLRHLIIELNLECHWESYSQYYDSGECSEICKGTAKEIRALFTYR